MIWHDPTCLAGPFTKERSWWSASPDVPGVVEDDASNTDIRVDLVQRTRAAIEAGTYDTPDKLEIAVLNLSRNLHLA